MPFAARAPPRSSGLSTSPVESSVRESCQGLQSKGQCDIAISMQLKAIAPGVSMTSSNAQDPPQAAVSDLEGLRILVVEDSWLLGMNLKSLLRALGAEVLGPAASAADAERLLSGFTPDVALVDFNLRGGELAHGLIDRLNEQGVRTVVISGYADVPLPPGKVAATLQKPIAEEQLLAALRPTTNAAQ
jgi:CheY-like chemotaxis protein